MVIFALDYWHPGSQLLLGHSLTFMQTVLAVAAAYVTGQIVAIPSSVLLEMGFARKLLRPPLVVLLDTPTWYEKLLSTFLIGHYYTPLAGNTKKRILQKAKAEARLTLVQILKRPDALFQLAYRTARSNHDACARMDDFRNQYGFARNMAMSGLIAACLLFQRGASDATAHDLAWLSVAMSAGMLVRFLKFYVCFTREVLQTYAYREATK